MVNLSKVDQERKLAKIMVEEALTDHNAQEVAVRITVWLGVEEEKEEGGNPCLP